MLQPGGERRRVCALSEQSSSYVRGRGGGLGGGTPALKGCTEGRADKSTEEVSVRLRRTCTSRCHLPGVPTPYPA